MKTSQQLMDFLLDVRPVYRYGEVRSALEELGWTAEPIEVQPQGRQVKATIFRHKDTSLFIILRRMRANSIMTAMDLLSVQRTLKNTGLYDSKQKKHR